MKAFLKRIDPAAWGMLGAAVLIAAITTWAIVRTPSDYIRAPAKACKATATGREDTQYVTTYMCASYDSKGTCTMQMPIITPVTYHEQSIACAWVEWN